MKRRCGNCRSCLNPASKKGCIGKVIAPSMLTPDTQKGRIRKQASVINMTHDDVKLAALSTQRSKQKKARHSSQNSGQTLPQSATKNGAKHDGNIAQEASRKRARSLGSWLADASSGTKLNATQSENKKLRREIAMMKGQVAAVLFEENPAARVEKARGCDVGEGYDLDSQAGKKMKRRDAAAVSKTLDKVTKGDALKRVQLTDHLHKKACGAKRVASTTAEDAEINVALEILEGHRKLNRHLNKTHQGRYPNNVRQDYQTANAVAVSCCSNIPLLAKLIGTNTRFLKGMKTYFDDYMKGTSRTCLHDNRGAERDDTLDERWVAHGKSYWLPPHTRPGEKKTGQIRVQNAGKKALSDYYWRLIN